MKTCPRSFVWSTIALLIQFIRDIFERRAGASPSGGVVRVLSHQVRRRGARPVGEDDSRAAGAQSGFLLGDLRRRREHPREDAGDRRPDSTGTADHGDGASHVRERDDRRDLRRAGTNARARDQRTSSRCAAIRRTASASSSRPKAASSTRINWFGASASAARSRSASPDFRRDTSPAAKASIWTGEAEDRRSITARTS